MGEATRTRHRRRVLIAWLGAAVGAAAVLASLWLVAARFEAPEQQAARAAPPSPSAITASVTKGDLSRVVTTRVTITRASRQTVQLGAPDGAGVVTAQPLPAGAAVSPGTVVSEVNGRPVIAMPGAFRFYRTLAVGSAGPDVAQLQRGLTAAGFEVGVDGRFGNGTAKAIRALYERAGYSPPEAASLASPSTPAPETGGSPASKDPATDALELPSNEMLVIGGLPAFLVSAPPTDAVIDDAAVVTVESGEPIASGTVDAAVATELRQGMTGSVRSAAGSPIPVTLSAIGTPERAGDPVPIRLQPTDALDDAMLHSEVLASLTVSIAARDSLLVPTASVITSGTDGAYVLKLMSDGRFHEIRVTETGRMGGRSAITAGSSDDLAVGDTVKVR